MSEASRRTNDGCRVPRLLIGVMMAAAGLVASAAAVAQPCDNQATLAHRACRSEVSDDYWIAVGNCVDVGDLGERRQCQAEARSELGEARGECAEQREARLELCDALGGDRYDPDLDPDDFVAEFTDLNPFFPLAVGNRWVYEGGEEAITVEVQDQTKAIEGFTCIVVNDQVAEDGELIEDTDDWYAQAANGDVYYFGEIALDYETFDGDDPEVAEVVDVDGSWKAGRDEAKPGVLVFAAPVEGTVYRQEMALGEAEDAAEVLSVEYAFGDDPELDAFVPQELAELLCDGDCLVTREFSPLEPDAEERKYYAPGVGLFLEVDPESGDIVQLVECNVDPRCDDLPTP